MDPPPKVFSRENTADPLPTVFSHENTVASGGTRGAPVEAPKASPEPATALVAPLPGGDAVDPALLDAAVAEINRLTTSLGLEHARAVGEVVVRRFGGGDLDAFKAGAGQHASWRALAEREDLAVSHSFLWSCVAVLDQLRQLPEDIGQALPVSHHRRLLAVKDEAAKLALATKAVEENLTVRGLEAEIAAHRGATPTETPRGRKPLPAFAKSIRGLPRLFEGVDASDVTDAALTALGPTEVLNLVTVVDQHRILLEALRAALGSGLVPEAPVEPARTAGAGRLQSSGEPAREAVGQAPEPLGASAGHGDGQDGHVAQRPTPPVRSGDLPRAARRPVRHSEDRGGDHGP